MTPSPGPPAIRVRRLRRHYGRFPALQDVTFDVPCGQLVALIGHNGAGKTTLLRTLATLDRPTAGQVLVMGHDVVRSTMDVRRRIGLVAHQTLLYPDLTAVENLRFYSRMYGLELSAEELARRLDRVGLLAVGRARVRALSHGTARRLAIARATLHDPPLLLLDEPYAGLDPKAASALDATLRGLAARGHTVLVTTHNVDRARALADTTLELRRGRLVDQESTAGTGSAAASSGRQGAPRDLGGRAPADDPADMGRDTVSGPSGADIAVASGPSFRGAVAALLWKDLLVELRAREAVPLALVFGLLVVVLFHFALPVGLGGASPTEAGQAFLPGVLWVALMFGSTLGLNRSSAAEVEEGGATGILLAPADPGATFLGKWLGGMVFSGVVAAALLPAAVVFLGVPSVPVGPVGAIVALALAGWVAAGTLVAAMVAGVRGREAVGPLVLYPLVIPLLAAAVLATSKAMEGAALTASTAGITLILAYDLIFMVLGFLTYAFVLEG